MMSNIQQIYYQNWNEQLPEKHQDYFWQINTMAQWIGMALQGSIYNAKARPYFYSTIQVFQAKEKFGSCRVYCTLCGKDAINEKYEDEKNDIEFRNQSCLDWINGKEISSTFSRPPNWLIKSYQDNGPEIIPSMKKFYENQRLSDGKWYRRIYDQAVKLWPEYRLAIINAADIPYILLESEKEIDEWFDKAITSVSKATWLNNDEKKNRILHLEEDRQFSKLVCDFKKRNN